MLIKGGELILGESCSHVVTVEARLCASCQQLRHLFVNTKGATKCALCTPREDA